MREVFADNKEAMKRERKRESKEKEWRRVNKASYI